MEAEVIVPLLLFTLSMVCCLVAVLTI